MIKTIKTWLPAFPGFYKTHYSFYNFYPEEDLKFLSKEEYDRRQEQHEEEVVDSIIEFIKESFTDEIKDIKLEEVVNPREYNYHNDTANVEIIIDTEKLAKKIYDNRENIEEYMKRNYTSSNDFISFYSNKFEYWEKETNNFLDFDNRKHYLGAMLEALMKEYEPSMYEYVIGRIGF